MRRLYPSVRVARALLSSEMFGIPLCAEVFEGGPVRWDAHSGYYLSDTGGVLFDTGSHALDTLSYVLGWDELKLLLSDIIVHESLTDIRVAETAAWGRFDVTVRGKNFPVRYGFDRLMSM